MGDQTSRYKRLNRKKNLSTLSFLHTFPNKKTSFLPKSTSIVSLFSLLLLIVKMFGDHGVFRATSGPSRGHFEPQVLEHVRKRKERRARMKKSSLVVSDWTENLSSLGYHHHHHHPTTTTTTTKKKRSYRRKQRPHRKRRKNIRVNG